MPENLDTGTIPEATAVPKRRLRLSVVWIIPLVAAVVTLGIAVQRIVSEGPTITITFNKAVGIEEGKTFVKYKEVNIGLVKKVKLSKNFRKVVVTAKIDKSASKLLVDDARFWIEQPRATLSGVSGISTLLSGNYIGLEPGKAKAQRRDFTGLEMPPAITMDQPGRQFMLKADNLGSIGNGSPLYYRQLNVGQVISYDLTKDGKSVMIEIFVRAPYDKYVTDQSRFWEAGGIDVSLGAEGFSLHTQSLLSVLIGGIAFETPPSADNPHPAADRTVFALFDSRAQALANPEMIITPYVLHFDETLHGLNVGAPVMFYGLPVGEVTDIGLDYDENSQTAHPRVDINLYPTRFLKHVKQAYGLDIKARSEAWRHSFLEKAVERGLRAQMRSGNLLTGKLYVALDIFPDAPKVKIDWTRSPAELPVVRSGTQDLQNKLSSILAKIDKMPIDSIGKNVRNLVVKLDLLMKHINEQTLPELKKTLEGLNRGIENINTSLVDKDAPTQQQLRETLKEISKTAQGISALAEYLELKPEALIRGKTQEKP